MAWSVTSTISIASSYPVANPYNTFDKLEIDKGVSWVAGTVTAGCGVQLVQVSTIATTAPWSEVKLLPGDYSGASLDLTFVNSAGAVAGLAFDTSVSLLVVDENPSAVVSDVVVVPAGATTTSLSLGAFTIVDETWHTTIYGGTIVARVEPTQFGTSPTFARVGDGSMTVSCSTDPPARPNAGPSSARSYRYE